MSDQEKIVRICRYADCGRRAHDGRWLCHSHGRRNKEGDIDRPIVKRRTPRPAGTETAPRRGYRRPISERLDSNSIPEPTSGCLLWTGAINASGYGVLGVGSRPLLAHRLAYEEANGVAPEGAYICHKCDVPSCINPLHLYAGDMTSNMTDKANRRRVAGERNPGAKLTAAAVREVRKLLGRFTHEAIATRYNVSACAIASIQAGRTWKEAAHG